MTKELDDDCVVLRRYECCVTAGFFILQFQKERDASLGPLKNLLIARKRF